MDDFGLDDPEGLTLVMSAGLLDEDPAAESELVACASCGRLLGTDPDDDPGDAEGPICGECYRSREFDAELAHEWSQDPS